MKNLEVLHRLRHHAVVGRHGEEHEVDPVRTRQHVPDESLVPWDVDHAGVRPVGKVQMREPEIDGDASVLLLLEPVRILPCQGLDQARLAVVDVAGCARRYRTWDRAEARTGPDRRPNGG